MKYLIVGEFDIWKTDRLTGDIAKEIDEGTLYVVDLWAERVIGPHGLMESIQSWEVLFNE
jgi:hypothetical protein